MLSMKKLTFVAEDWQMPCWELDFGLALPFAMGSDSEFQDCASPTASFSGLMSTLSD
jgi:hypothetical protein